MKLFSLGAMPTAQPMELPWPPSQTLCGLCEEADKVWKEANDIIFSDLLRYDLELATFISSVEDALKNKCDEIWKCVHSLMEVINYSPQTSLSLALQILH